MINNQFTPKTGGGHSLTLNQIAQTGGDSYDC